MLNQLKAEAQKTPIMEMSGHIAKHLESGFFARILLFLTRIIPLLRGIFEFLIPIVLGIYAITIIWSGRI